MKSFNLAPSAFPVRQTETRTLSCPFSFVVTSFEPVVSTVVLYVDHFVPDRCCPHRNNVSIVKIELVLDSTDVHQVCYDTINYIRWILLSCCNFSSKREPMPSHKLCTPSTTSIKRIFDPRIVVFFVHNAFWPST